MKQAATPDPAALSARGLHKSFGSQKVLSDLDYDLRAGEIQLLLGANGAGKSTLLRILSGLCRADRGSVVRPASSAQFPACLNHVGHQLFLYQDMSPLENLRFFCSLSGATESLEHIETQWNLTPFRNRPLRELSRGQQMRVSLARALLNRPRFLLLDEPSGPLDDASVELLCANLRAFVTERPGSGVLIASHDIERLSAIANTVRVLETGSIVRNAGDSGSKLDAIVYYRSRNR